MTTTEPSPISRTLQTRYATFDTETRYSEEYSVADLGNEAYVRDPRFECYLVIVHADDGFKFIGHPKDAPWDQISQYAFLSANAGFDQAVLRRMIELGQAPAFAYPKEWHCTSNMGVYFGLPRALAKALKAEFGIEHDKSVRNKDMLGIGHAELEANPALKEKVYKYAALDGEGPLLLWQKYGHLWPEIEKEISNETYRMCREGVYVDKAKIEYCIQILETACAVNEDRIPWSKDYPILSPKALRTECAKHGINPPASLAKTSEECALWEAKYGDLIPFVKWMRNWRRANALLEKFRTMHVRIGEDGRMAYSLLYYGGSTGRFSGGGGYNPQNIPKEPMYFDAEWNITSEANTARVIDMRSTLVAPPGKLLAAVDYAQIEARVTPWVAGDRATLDRIRPPSLRSMRFKEMLKAETSVYQVHAELAMGWKGMSEDPSTWNLKKADKVLYALAKARVLGLGFGCGWNKFIALAKLMLDKETFKKVFGAPVPPDHATAFVDYLIQYDKPKTYLKQWPLLTEEEKTIWVNSWLQVTDYRTKNPKITALWRRMGDELARSCGGDYTVTLPSGRDLFYYGVHKRADSYYVYTTKGDPASRAYGPLLVENLVQATARDILCEAILRLRKAGFRVVMHVHDEIIVEIDRPEDADRIMEIMCESPRWARTLPIGAEADVTTFYRK